MEKIEPLFFIRSIRQTGDHWFTIEWTDGKIFEYRLSDLQRQCMCARCRDEVTGKMLIDPSSIDDSVEAVRIASVGTYALQIFFTKGCSKGIYSFVWLRQLMNHYSGIMKNPIVVLLFIVCGLLSGCSSSSTQSPMEIWATKNSNIKVLSTTGMIDDIVGKIGGERVDRIPLITGEIDPHSYELVKGDDEKLFLAQLVFYNGLGLEHGASLRYQLKAHPNAIDLGGLVCSQVPQRILHVGKDIDPHIWMDISLWSYIITPIEEALSRIDPEGKEVYAKNAAILREEMLKEHQNIFLALQEISSEKRFLVTSHDAFNYFTKAYLATSQEIAEGSWQKRFEAPEGLAPEGQLSTSDIQKVIDHLIKYHIQVVFSESNVSRDSLKKIIHACLRMGLTIKISSKPLYGDAMGPLSSTAGSYLTMMRYDANVLIQEWQ